MPQIVWYQAVDKITPHIVKISTPEGHGTGFLISYGGSSGELCAIATAAHVLGHAHYWEEPIRIDHGLSGNTALLRNPDRAIYLDESRDSAAIIIPRGSVPLPDDPLPLAPESQYLRVGNEIGWMGYPALPDADLCFFSGRVSATLKDHGAYLVDGVAVDGVSGGPVFFLADAIYPPIMLIGLLTAYAPNRTEEGNLPGLSFVRNVESLRDLTKNFLSFDQAKSSETPPKTAP